MWFISVGVSWIWKWRLSLENKIGIRKSQWQKIFRIVTEKQKCEEERGREG